MIAVVELLLKAAHVLIFRANVLSGGEAVLRSAQSLLSDNLYSIGTLAVFGQNDKVESVFSLGKDVVAIVSTSLQIRTVGL